MESSKEQFKQAINNNFGAVLGKDSTTSLMQDMNKYSKEMKEANKLKGGKADKKTLKDIAKKHTWPKGDPLTRIHYINKKVEELESELKKGIKVEMKHTKDKEKATEIAMDNLWDDPKYYHKNKKIEGKEQIVRKKVNTDMSDKIVGTTPMNTPIGKISSISKTNEESEKKVTAKQQFAKDLQDDPDFHEFKKNAKYKKGGSEFTFGVPNVSSEDPYIKKQTKYGRPGRGKEEATEATGSGSSGQYSGPVFGGDDEFWRKSKSETPSLKEGLATGAIGIDKVEAKEATGSGSVGGYSTPSMWAKSTKKKDWGPSRKTQIPGGGFVKVKKKCTKFPYCNQGDINALKITKNESVKEAIKNVALKHNISEQVIKNILEYEFSKLNNK